MKKLTVLNKSIITALCVALCVVLPMALHAIPKGGVLFSPMHLPVLLCGLVCGAPSGLICGILGPFISSMLTGMPAFGYMPIMMIELGLYGLISGLVMQLLRSGKLVIDLYAALIIAMLGGRVITGILRALIFAGGSYSWSAWATGYFVSRVDCRYPMIFCTLRILLCAFSISFSSIATSAILQNLMAPS